MRRRIGARTSSLTVIGRALLVVVALGAIWYGAMLLLLALKVSPGTVESISGYRAVYDQLARLVPGDVDSTVRLIAGLAGLAAFLLFGWLAFKELPRPYVRGTGLRIPGSGPGTTDVRARVVERVAEVSARSASPAVADAAGHWRGDGISLAVTVDRTQGAAQALGSVRAATREALERQGLPVVPVDVTLTRFDRQRRRDLT